MVVKDDRDEAAEKNNSKYLCIHCDFQLTSPCCLYPPHLTVMSLQILSSSIPTPNISQDKECAATAHLKLPGSAFACALLGHQASQGVHRAADSLLGYILEKDSQIFSLRSSELYLGLLSSSLS
jgi:hypothetical protein